MADLQELIAMTLVPLAAVSGAVIMVIVIGLSIISGISSLTEGGDQ